MLEDVAQAIGGTYHGEYLGSIGNIGAFSFQFNKIITTGEGGMVITNDRSKWLRASAYHDPISLSMGRDINPEESPQFPGQNYRASEFIGAIGLVQLDKLDNLIKVMRDRKARILAGLGNIDGLKLRHLHDANGDTATNIIFFLPKIAKAKEFSEALTAENVRSRILYDPDVIDYHIYANWHQILQKMSMTSINFPWSKVFYKGKVRYSKKMCPKSLDILARAVIIDISPLLTVNDTQEIIHAIKKVAKAVL